MHRYPIPENFVMSIHHGASVELSNNVTHTLYLTSFRVHQCQEFLKHKCKKHKPFTCFNWHFPGQRRRPVNDRCNYNTDVYCSTYDESSGCCQDNDACSLLHKNTGDTEYLYHPKIYKTVICTYLTGPDGNCTKRGIHCPYAHGVHDLRQPDEFLPNNVSSKSRKINDNTIDIRTIKDILPNSNDLRWMSLIFVYTFYKTKPCPSLSRSCRQGYSCANFHDFRDTRRSPQQYKFQSTPCPNVKVNNKWCEPSKCPNGDHCVYCHTRTEQQFHIDIYKSTKCNDINRAGYCPRGVFCAFSHAEIETQTARDIKIQLENGKSFYNLFKGNQSFRH